MGIARSALLWISENRKLRQSLPRYKFIRRAVTRFMPGEELQDALNAAADLEAKNINTILTHLGENVSDPAEAERVRNHYLEALETIHGKERDAHISVKLTQLGLDLGEELCFQHLSALVERAESVGNRVWIDMEQSPYVDRTLSIYKAVRKKHSNIGVCLQSYLYRTKQDLEQLIPLSPSIRLVKGAYLEPRDIAYPAKRDVDSNFFALGKILLENVKNGTRVGIATHDLALIGQIQQEAARIGLSKEDYEFQLLYGIQTAAQLRLATEGYRIRTLISYGAYWFPWYVRRLAERPANIFFVIRNMLKS